VIAILSPSAQGWTSVREKRRCRTSRLPPTAG